MNAALFVSLLLAQAGSSDWPQWRGPDRTGVVAATLPAPEGWPEGLTPAWRVEVGLGHASPVVVDGRVYVFARSDDDDREIVRALDLATGATRWEQGYEAPYTMNPAARGHGKGPKSTPLVATGRVFTLGIDGMLSSFSAVTGKMVWQTRFDDRFAETSPLYGHGTSPILAASKLIVHLGGPGRGALMALEPATGDVVWSTGDDGPGYTSPMVIGGELVTQTETHLAGFSLDSGARSWEIPFRTPYDQNIVTSVPLGEGRFLFSGLDQPTRVLSLAAGDAPASLWESEISFYMSTPVLARDRLIGFSNERRGHVVALDRDTGRTLWQSEGRMGENAAVVRWGPWVLVLTNEAVLHVIEASATSFTPIATYDVASTPTWAHPVPTRLGILIKDESSLSLLSLEAP